MIDAGHNNPPPDAAFGLHIDEIWKRVPSEPGVLASSKGRVLLPPANKPMPRGGYCVKPTSPSYGRRQRIPATNYEYWVVSLPDYSEATRRQRPKKVSQLVCEAFHGPKPFPGAVVMHLDDNSLNNTPGNLKWGTQKENLSAPSFRAKRRQLSRNQQSRARAMRTASEASHG